MLDVSEQGGIWYNGLPHQDDEFQYSERRRVKYALRS